MPTTDSANRMSLVSFKPYISIANLLLCSALALSLVCAPALAQDGRPNPQSPPTQGGGDGAGEGGDSSGENQEGQQEGEAAQFDNGLNRFPTFDGNEKAAFILKEVTVEELIPFIVSATGKVVLPVNLQQLTPKKITIHADEKRKAFKKAKWVFRNKGEIGTGAPPPPVGRRLKQKMASDAYANEVQRKSILGRIKNIVRKAKGTTDGS